MRYIGVDLHTTQITVCYLKEKDDISVRKYQLIEIEKFVSDLEKRDEIAVEATCNTRWFREKVKEKVSRVVLVNPRQFEVVRNSVKKTDKNDAINLAKFLKADLLPEVRAKREEAEKVNSLVNTRTKMVRLKTSLINKIHALFVSNGRKLKKTSLASEKGLDKVLQEDWSEIEQVELEVIIEQIRSLKQSIKKLDKAIDDEAMKLKGFENLKTISGIGSLSAAILLAVIGNIKDFETSGKLASYFGIVPRVSNSNETVNHGRITKRGSKTGRTALVQCSLSAIKKNEYLKTYYEQVKARRGHGKAKIALARKFLGIIYNTLMNNWVFRDFNNFELAE
ncbi:MAG: IS110 family transposase [Acidobacteria bacterium]|nr:IS110 family transposase [Acidobacteriota bacterium]MCA1640234.1 IS110 family transposase [Acidobacteriota bacterium]